MQDRKLPYVEIQWCLVVFLRKQDCRSGTGNHIGIYSRKTRDLGALPVHFTHESGVGAPTYLLLLRVVGWFHISLHVAEEVCALFVMSMF